MCVMLSYVVDAAVDAGVPSAVPACHGGEQQACAAPPQEVPAHPKVRVPRLVNVVHWQHTCSIDASSTQQQLQ
jgi:hypothetical protein